MAVQVAGILQGCAKTTGRALDSDCIVEPVRGPLIPGFAAVKRAAKAAGKSSMASLYHDCAHQLPAPFKCRS